MQLQSELPGPKGRDSRVSWQRLQTAYPPRRLVDQARALACDAVSRGIEARHVLTRGAEHVQDIAIRHTAGAPDRFIEQVQPALIEYANSSAHGITAALQAAQAARLDDKVGDFLAKRFGPRVAAKMQHAHMLEEGRPVETVWDAVTAATAYAREIPHTADRVELETIAGSMLSVVS